MGKPDKKLKKILFITGITGAVYGIFRYLLPLVVPFLLAWGLAELLEPSADWISANCRITFREKTCRLFGRSRIWKERTFGISKGIAGTLELAAALVLLGVGCYAAGRKLLFEAGMLMEQIPVWIAGLDVRLTGICRHMEKSLCLKDGLLVLFAQDMLKGLMTSVKNTAMPSLMVNSVSVFRLGVRGFVALIIVLAATGMTLQELDVWKKCCRRSMFQEELKLLGKRFAVTLQAYGKTQLLIMILTTIICMLGFWLMKNPYYILLGIVIGLLDALPVLGTGTVLIPWALVRFLQKRWASAVGMLALYVVCYLLREILEAKLMGKQVGLSPLETLISMYVGVRLFGVAGFLLGPVGLLAIRDLAGMTEKNEGETGM